MAFLIVIFIFLLSFLFRGYGFFVNYPFWVDEFSTAIQSQYILKYGLSVFSNPDVYIEQHNISTHILTAFLFQILGNQEWVARLPSLIFGSMLPVAVFFLAKYLFNSKTGLAAALLTAFSYFEITWSRQARSYVLLQLIMVITTYLYFKVLDEKGNKRTDLILLALFSLLGFITHSFFYLFLLSLIMHFVFIKKNRLIHIFNKWWIYVLFILFIAIAKHIGLFDTFMTYFSRDGFGANNVWYYHSFLWREYSLLTFLTLIGFILAFNRKKSIFLFLSIFFITHLFFITFGFKPLVTRYVLPIFPFMLVLSAYAISHLPNLFFKNQKHILTTFASLLLTIVIVVNGDKFVNRPKYFYSVNHDFREIALVDYKQIYDRIKHRGDLDKNETAVIETWPARTYWYVGIDYKPSYFFQWRGNLPYDVNNKGEKVVPRNNQIRLIEDVDDLEKAIKTYAKGFILIDDTSLPKDVIDYVEKNMKKELYLDHYPLDDNPYSIWPVTLYSWGIK
ncbi:hypothetical protein A2866_03980 [Candidatus Roizmanbacteria bacterium RIFCSPHIGHO2_01_FULL_39_8]|uniref:Glycosyltransferase RgtA/B/C/D-like domain-containing protein n=2 Tax=Candidatus Roizmaniibacteriota TaxID=1752723 RepID=A0A1F7GPE7_9BACT|nr:MAG: hypothetical protein A2866_03980 [Candidatus Roizmanbacteria bacterium RIFCSPHIGHO2_01_FULL_39_8]OGK28122.1 MAG: hypothetical protein A3C28_01190 [Candidatus Roizmanbacteria bacterium RIFCSPHIGHO2_02_FULL_39_9]